MAGTGRGAEHPGAVLSGLSEEGEQLGLDGPLAVRGVPGVQGLGVVRGGMLLCHMNAFDFRGQVIDFS